MLTIPVVVLVFGGISLVISPGTSSILNPGLHGLTEVTYAYASVAQNNGSAFAGLSANTPCGVIVIVGGLIYFPMLILGPIGERITG